MFTLQGGFQLPELQFNCLVALTCASVSMETDTPVDATEAAEVARQETMQESDAP